MRLRILKDNCAYYGEIPECQGVYANARNLEECRNELADVLEDWLLLRIHKNLAVPRIDGFKVTVTKEVVA